MDIYYRFHRRAYTPTHCKCKRLSDYRILFHSLNGLLATVFIIISGDAMNVPFAVVNFIYISCFFVSSSPTVCLRPFLCI